MRKDDGDWSHHHKQARSGMMIDRQILTTEIEQLAQKYAISGAMLVSQDTDVLFEQAYGFANRQLGVPNTLETKFHIASVTKMFIAMTALILLEQGRIDLQKKPGDYMEELTALDENITLHHLLSHTSGIQDIYDVPHLRYEMHTLKHEQGDLLSYLITLPQLFPPGQGWSYSSTGYILMGYLMERVTGVPFAELLRRYVLSPLSMTQTGLDFPRRINPGRAYGHTVEDGQLINADNDKLSAFAAHGELYSTVHDLKIWCDAMFNCPLVAPQTLALMFMPYGQVTPTLHYGYGWFLAPRFRMHGGGTPGFISRIRQYPEQKASVILLCNSDQTDPDVLLKAIEPLLIE
jgi:CubicO group peptidase (beta-lactamase class C family)